MCGIIGAKFYNITEEQLETIEKVFHNHELALGQLKYKGRPVRPSAIKKTFLLTVEGERDDISGIGQTRAAHALCRSLPQKMHLHHEQEKVGHYGLFNGKRFRTEVAPAIKSFITAQS